MRQLLTLAGLVSLLTLGCAPPPTEELLTLTFAAGDKAPPVELDIQCSNGGCDSLAELEAQVTYTPHAMSAPDASVELLQYRVDYQLDPPHDTVQLPYFAGNTSVRVPIDQTVAFNVVAIGERQRERIRGAFPIERIEGRATLTLAGYDSADAAVRLQADFDVFFDDFVDEVAP